MDDSRLYGLKNFCKLISRSQPIHQSESHEPGPAQITEEGMNLETQGQENVHARLDEKMDSDSELNLQTQIPAKWDHIDSLEGEQES